PMAARMTGYVRAELLRLAATYLFRFGGQGGMQRLRQAANKSTVFHSQDGFFLRTAQEGVWVPVNLTMARLHLKPKTLALITARDITERKQAEAAAANERYLLKTLMDYVPDFIYFKDAASRFTRVNKAVVRRFGMKDASEVVGKTDFDFFSREHAEQALRDE